ncbi:BREX-1 system adenine-specific DNA-methyltransferase PglX [Corynebacterium sp. SCR221107]|uniref:BREX-1 system adenine-specific DNA-methyltransferase PglX n=1 Tax=Corynebacterium sp. SCR221107 TaxID=3017361 RepID=UPI0022EC91A9|nr:BREX-1 system adenine-specific DNA-methyltransferase PglX [Corynebacterium sp. SCR221107]WBT09183.1 BREX-1 system adenine-specific DNA-methyltransferase PglX [Corynebacterium sp. SCR221107]
MDINRLKKFATAARTQLLNEVEVRMSSVLAPNSPERVESPNAIAQLEAAINAAGGGQAGHDHVVEKVAYTWFNRFVALRFMDANGYTNAGVVSPAEGKIGQPEVLALAKRGQLDTSVVKAANVEKIMALLSGARQAKKGMDAQAEAYGLLLSAYCAFWHNTMPFMFEASDSYTGLLVPNDLLSDSSVLSATVEALDPETCQDVEVIGWLYQFYISERKDEVFADFKKNKKAGAAEIPAATQLFTPHWIVRYLVENSIGRLWLLNNPNSKIRAKMKYYIDPVDEETDFLKISSPEELTVIDPACGSGHMLTYAFDLLYAIYEEKGYAPSDIPNLILENNIHGTEIDQRAGSLAAFALAMKATAKRRRFLRRPVAPKICVLEPITITGDEVVRLYTPGGDHEAEFKFWNQFENADTFGSLLRPDADLTARLANHIATLEHNGDLLLDNVLARAKKVIEQAQYLSKTYSVVVANPPYMGGSQMDALLSQFMKKQYPTAKSDLFAAFILRCTDLARNPQGIVAMITMQSWMFLSSYEKLRSSLLENQRITSMLHLGPRAFDSIGGEVVSSTAFTLVENGKSASGNAEGVFLRLVDGNSEAEKQDLFTKALASRNAEANFYTASVPDFSCIPGAPIAYWLSEKMRATFSSGRSLSEIANLRQGLATADNDRFLRHWWEVSNNRTAFGCTSREEAKNSQARWFPYNKGGNFRKWYGNQEYVVNWENDGEEIFDFKPRSVIRNPNTYFSSSVSWSDVSSGEAAFRRFPAGFIHDVKGMSAFGAPDLLDQVALLMNSSFAKQALAALAPTLNFQVGDVGKTPVIDGFQLPPITEELVEISKKDWDMRETSWNFSCNSLVKLSEWE